jgi:hypothetical protein
VRALLNGAVQNSKMTVFFDNFIFGDLEMVLILMMEVEVVVIVTREVLIGCEQLCLFLKLLIFHLESQFLASL